MKNPADVKLSYQESAVCGATPIQLVVILYDAAIEDIRRALAAMKTVDIEARAAALRHALLVLQQLQGTLDFEKGGTAAKQFEQFYNLIRAKLLEAQMRNSCQLMQQQVQFMVEVRDCWMQAEAQLKPKPREAPPVATIASEMVAAGERGSTSEWNA
jgi:flagellar protein FliS